MGKLQVVVVACILLLLMVIKAECQWVQVGGPTGEVYAFTSTLYGSGVSVFAGTFDGTVFRSRDNGVSWQETDNGLKPYNSMANRLGLRCLATIPGDIGSAFLLAGTNSGLFLSTDQGESWYLDNGNLPNSSITGSTAVAALVLVDTELFAGTENGVFLSTNYGLNWNGVNSGLTDTLIYSLIANGSYLFAGTFSGVFVSSNRGSTWTLKDSGMTSISHVEALAALRGRIFAGTYDGNYVSTNNGESWIRMDTSGLSEGVTAFAVVDSEVYAGWGNGGVSASTDFGNSWSYLGLPNKYISSLTTCPILSDGYVLLSGTAQGIYRSTDYGRSWHSPGVPNPNVWFVSNIGTKLFAGTPSGAFASTDNGTSWTDISIGAESQSVRSFTALGNRIFAGIAYQGEIFVSSDSGTSWVAADSGLSAYNVTTLATNGTDIIAGLESMPVILNVSGSSLEKTQNTGYGVYISTDYGSYWSPINNGLPEYPITALGAEGASLLAGTFAGLYRSTDNGANWAEVGGQVGGIAINSIVISNSEAFMGTTNAGFFVSIDSGAIWTEKDSGLTDTYIISIAVVGRNIFAGTFGGKVFLSTNDGAAWTAIDSGLGEATVQGLTIVGGNIFAATNRSGLWRRPLSQLPLEVRKNSPEIPASYHLDQNFPNPFNPTTVINYQLLDNSLVTLKVYDVLGREVIMLVNERQSAGNHSVRFNAANLPSGVYFYRLKTQNYVNTMKMVLLK